jgi:hypothetical protein
VIKPRPWEGNSRSRVTFVSDHGKTLPAERAEITTVLQLEPFERFVYVMQSLNAIPIRIALFSWAAPGET